MGEWFWRKKHDDEKQEPQNTHFTPHGSVGGWCRYELWSTFKTVIRHLIPHLERIFNNLVIGVKN